MARPGETRGGRFRPTAVGNPAVANKASPLVHDHRTRMHLGLKPPATPHMDNPSAVNNAGETPENDQSFGLKRISEDRACALFDDDERRRDVARAGLVCSDAHLPLRDQSSDDPALDPRGPADDPRAAQAPRRTDDQPPSGVNRARCRMEKRKVSQLDAGPARRADRALRAR